MSKRAKVLGFAALVIGSFLSFLDGTIVNIALPEIAKYYHESLNDISWVSTIYLLGLSVFLITASKVADQFGRKKVFIAGLLLFGISSALCGLASSMLFLIAMRAIQGIGAAIMTPVILPLGLEIFGKERRGMIISIAGGISALAAASGPPIGGVLIQYLDWKAVFFVNVPFCFITVILAVIFLEESYDRSVSKKVDLSGMGLLTISLFCLIFSLLKGNDYGWSSILIVSMFIISAAALGAFILVEFKSKEPMIPMRMFKEMTFTASSFCYLLTGFAIASPLLILNFFLESVLGYGTLHAGLILMTISLAAMVSAILGNLLAKWLGSIVVNFLGIILMATGILLMVFINQDTSSMRIVVDLAITGMGTGLATQMIASSIKFIPQEKSGIASGIVNAFRQIGTCLGIAILVTILNSNITGAVGDIKQDMSRKIQVESRLDSQVKGKLLQYVEMLNKDSSISDQDMGTIMEKEGKKLVEAVPAASRPAAVKKLDEEKAVALGLVREGQEFRKEKLSKAFDGTFKVAAIILFCLSFAGFFTDRRSRKHAA